MEHVPHDSSNPPRGVVVGIVRSFLSGPVSMLLIVASLILGALAVTTTSREEEPQIVVPMADVVVQFPGRSPAEVEELVTRPLERLLWQVDGVEHVYSVSQADQAMVTVRFFVGQDRERSLIKLRDQIESHIDIVPPGVANWVVKPAQIDDVPIVTLTLFSERRSSFELRRLAEECRARLDGISDLSRTEIFGGEPREITVEAGIADLAARGVCLQDLQMALVRGDSPGGAGTVLRNGQAMALRTGPADETAATVRNTVVRSPADRTVRVGDVAEVRDGPAEPTAYHHIGFGPAAKDNAEFRGRRLPAVTLAFSKKKGTNSISVADGIIKRAETLKGTVLPDDVRMVVTRNSGEAANAKVDDLLSGMFFAILTVVALIWATMGWREALVVGLSVPVSFALALFVNELAGFTINRVTLFALILSLGIVVDDPIINVDNIQRHIRMGRHNPFTATLWAVHEMAGPVIMSTMTIIVSFLPMLWITRMMGPYMKPMAVNVPLTIFFSAVCALTFVPWLSHRLLAHLGPAPGAPARDQHTATSPWVRTLYRGILGPFLDKRRNAFLLLGAVVLMLIGSGLLVVFRQVPLKMLPFDNKNEFHLVIDMPEGSSLEATDRTCQEVEAVLATVNEVRDFETYTGINSPIDFNGLVRHYGMRRQPHQAEIRVNLVDKLERLQQSHDLVLRLRDELTAAAKKHGARIAIVEIPPGPPVLSTLTVEITGDATLDYDQLITGARVLEKRLAEVDSRHIVQIDDMAAKPGHSRMTVTIDRDKAARHGLGVADVTQALQAAMGGVSSGVLHAEGEREPLQVKLRLPFAERGDPDRLGELWLRAPAGGQVQLAELATVQIGPEPQTIYRKDLERVVFVTAECVGRPPGEIVLDTQRRLKSEPLPPGIRARWTGEGEWQITVDVFRDLGIAFGVALLGIYLLLVLQTGSFMMPMVMMTAIPLTAIGIMPGFWLLNLVSGHTVAGYASPVWFTATAMIGMIALGGIVIRNSIVLIEFIENALREGKPMREALLDSGAVRFRPIMLTALTAMLGAWPITLDPIFSGLAWSLIFGLLASTLFTLILIPTVYNLIGPRLAPVDEREPQ
jgi:multidrug efflux pump subunit AcrB